MGNEPRLNFISSTLLTLLSVGILVGSYGIHVGSDEPLHASPALMPGMLGIALLLCSLLLLRQSVGEDGLRTRLAEARMWLGGVARHRDTRRTLVGLLMMVVYTFVLLGNLQFWAASLIFMVALLAFLRAARWHWILIISVATVGGIVLVFSVIFNIPLP